MRTSSGKAPPDVRKYLRQSYIILSYLSGLRLGLLRSFRAGRLLTFAASLRQYSGARLLPLGLHLAIGFAPDRAGHLMSEQSTPDRALDHCIL